MIVCTIGTPTSSIHHNVSCIASEECRELCQSSRDNSTFISQTGGKLLLAVQQAPTSFWKKFATAAGPTQVDAGGSRWCTWSTQTRFEEGAVFSPPLISLIPRCCFPFLFSSLVYILVLISAPLAVFGLSPGKQTQSQKKRAVVKNCTRTVTC